MRKNYHTPPGGFVRFDFFGGKADFISHLSDRDSMEIVGS